MLQIRLATVEDAASLAALNDEFNDTRTTAQDARERLGALRGKELVCVAEAEDGVCGFACAQVYSSICYPEPVAEITELFLREPFRRQGVGQSMLDFLEKEFLGRCVSEVHVITGKNNTEANALYRAAGYSKDDDVIFRKRLGDR